MEKDLTTRYVAVVEKCAMTEVALRHILTRESGKNYSVRFFKDTQALKRELKSKDFTAIIFSLSGNRRSRLESLLFLHEIARYCPEMQRIVLATDEAEMRLISHLTPSRLHGIFNKSACRIQLQERLLQLLDHSHQANESVVNQKQGLCNQILSPTEHTILRYMSYGYSLPEIATQLERNIKTIRAHKFNAMTKLGVSSDMGLLSAADILMRLSANNDDTRGMRLAL
ncbi:DNA-binding transcriptional activator BglJ [Klebsiella huaxiensis]|uniref:DNA-binding transcriptional activator BglJ n=1 Tax=Klebsiella huaxiensis TaxID=2153354 RepID=A0A564I1T8_9ENTR|nr:MULTISPECIES: DNA-binding transcriptional activator BglJ [Klebsiella]MBA7931849.1 DNA-binding transcriptional activator BglJ [Klebsiella sp. RHBSTW-00215]MDG1641262.1 DNA-binding transcriptional activator BglJ [Klebsiella huaxiensis]QBG10121.1 DNA-binding transcriptional activator BglJ [Klebsiella huaxiensis]WEJ89153.1 MAG: DNA-binding transcriptional activator BglJ [Klebsiella huaxiensis]VUS38659.1 Transcriptional activator protein BglJ [Klebsiella huaxiensis]